MISIIEKENSFGDIDYVCNNCKSPVIREEKECPVCNKKLNWKLFDTIHPFHKEHA